MKKHLIISSESSNLFTTQRFIIEAKKLKFKTIQQNPYAQFINTSKVYSKNCYLNTSYLFRTSGIRNDDFDLTVAQFYQNYGAKIVNPIDALKNFRTKDHQIMFLNQNKIPTIPSLFYRGKITDELTAELKKINSKEEYIIKMNRGNGGIGVQIIRGLDSLISTLETFEALRDQKLLIQPYYPHSKEYRLLFGGDKLLACIEKKIHTNDFRGNSKRSTGVYKQQAPTNILEIGYDAFKKSNLIYAGVDIFEDDKGIKILEINAVPGYEQVENLSGKNIAREILLLL